MLWRFENLPELQHLSDSQRKALLQQSIGRGTQIRLWLGCFTRAFLLSLVLALVLNAALESLNLTDDVQVILNLITFPVLLILLTMGLYLYAMIRIRGQIRQYLTELRGFGVDVPVCLKCGYAVDKRTPRCPECGHEQ